MADYLNYVWLSNKDYYDPSKYKDQSPIPTDYVENAFAVASENSHITSIIWCDFKQMGKSNMDRLTTNKRQPKNLSFRDLNEIADYKEIPLFREETDKKNIWRKVDLARVLMLSHVLSFPDAEAVYYSDMDVYKLPVSPEHVKVIKQAGFAFDYLSDGGTVENRFIGIHISQKNGVENTLVPCTKEAILDENAFDGWRAMMRYHEIVRPDSSSSPDERINFSRFTDIKIKEHRREFPGDLDQPNPPSNTLALSQKPSNASATPV